MIKKKPYNLRLSHTQKTRLSSMRKVYNETSGTINRVVSNNSERSSENVFLSDISPTDKTWDEHRADADSVKLIYEISNEFEKYANRISSCSNILTFNDKLKLNQAFFCRVRYCPVCQWRRSLYWRAMMFQKLEQIKQNYPTHRFIFLTLTVKNCDIVDLKKTLKEMNSAWKRLIETKRFSEIVDGFIRTTEVTRNPKTDQAHPHFHALLLVKPSFFKGTKYIKQLEWVEMWAKALRVDYMPSVHVKAVKADNSKQMDKAICETLKYSVKPTDLVIADGGAWLHELTRQTHKMRFIATGGVLKGCLKLDDLTDKEMVHVEKNNEEDLEDKEEKSYFSFVFKPTFKRYVFAPSLSKF